MRGLYFSVLMPIDQVPYGDALEQHSDAFDENEYRQDFIYVLLHSL